MDFDLTGSVAKNQASQNRGNQYASEFSGDKAISNPPGSTEEGNGSCPWVIYTNPTDVRQTSAIQLENGVDLTEIIYDMLKQVSTKFADVLAFSGPAPERINGRLAMVGFVSAIGVELAKGDGLMAQLANGGLSWFLYTAVLLSVASLVPLFRGESPQSTTAGPMSSDAELWNGRLAMLGMVALAITEYVKGGPLV